ncbi:MAG: hypothetical protein IT371_22670 [Deltaproteobacteria bacterium]|nr:hypothetical protein [Deltaproteobacteria bacterium]
MLAATAAWTACRGSSPGPAATEPGASGDAQVERHRLPSGRFSRLRTQAPTGLLRSTDGVGSVQLDRAWQKGPAVVVFYKGHL